MSEAQRLPPGHWLAGRWQVSSWVATGPLADVYEVRDMVSGQVVTLKLLTAQLSAHQRATAELQGIARMVNELGQPCFVAPAEYGHDPTLGRSFAVTPRIAIPSLAARVAQRGPLTLPEWRSALARLGPALDAAHARGLVHRDLKPTNVFVEGEGVYVTDFGIASLYVAVPELAWSAVAGWSGPDALDPGARPVATMDVYALGLVTFYALTGRSPLKCMNVGTFPSRDVLWAEVTVPLGSASQRARELNANLTPALDEWFGRALAPHPSARFASVTEMVNELGRAAGQPVPVQQVQVPPRPTSQGPRTPQTNPHPTAAINPGSGTMILGPGQLPWTAAPAQPPPAPVRKAPAPPEAAAPFGASTVAVTADELAKVMAAAPVPGRQAPVPVSPSAPQPFGPSGSPNPAQGGGMAPFGSPEPAAGLQARPAIPVGAPGEPAPAPARPRAHQGPRAGTPRPPSWMIAAAVAGAALFTVAAAAGLWFAFRAAGAPDSEAAASASTPAMEAAPPKAAPAAAPETKRAPEAPAVAPLPSVPREPAPPPVAKVTFVCDPAPCQTVECDGKDVEDPSSPVELEPGKYTCRVARDGYVSVTRSFDLEAGAERTETFKLTARPKASSGGSPKPSKPRKPRTPCGTFINPCR